MLKRLLLLILCIIISGVFAACGEPTADDTAQLIELEPEVSSSATSTEIESAPITSNTASSATSSLAASSATYSREPVPVESFWYNASSATPSKPAVSSASSFSSAPSASSAASVPATSSMPSNSTVSSAASSAASSQAAERGYIMEIFSLVNRHRTEAGLAPLMLDNRICSVAGLRADEITEVFSHERPNGSSCFTALNEANITYTNAGENIAAGQRNAAAVVESWMNSPGHRANIMSEKFNSIGIGHIYKSNDIYGHYWVQMFTYITN